MRSQRVPNPGCGPRSAGASPFFSMSWLPTDLVCLPEGLSGSGPTLVWSFTTPVRLVASPLFFFWNSVFIAFQWFRHNGALIAHRQAQPVRGNWLYWWLRVFVVVSGVVVLQLNDIPFASGTCTGRAQVASLLARNEFSVPHTNDRADRRHRRLDLACLLRPLLRRYEGMARGQH